MLNTIDDAFLKLRTELEALSPRVDEISRAQSMLAGESVEEAAAIITLYGNCVSVVRMLVAKAVDTDPDVLGAQMEETYGQIQNLANRVGTMALFLSRKLGPEGIAVINEEIDTQVTIICRACATPTKPNDMMLCHSCMLDNVTIGDNIPKQLSIVSCRHCQRWQKANNVWMIADLESQELMAMLLKKIKGLNKIEIEEAKYVWCEPNSRRVKISILIRDVIQGVKLEKNILVTWTVIQGICAECERHFTPHSWKSMVSLRQKCHNKRTLQHLEELIRKNDMQNKVVSLETHKHGFDMAFNKPTDAEAFVRFIKKHFVVKHTMSEQLVSHDANNNTANKKFTHSILIAPVSKGDLIVIPKEYRKHYGSIPQLMLVVRLTTSISLMDPFTMRAHDVSGMTYWKYPFIPVATQGHMTRFVVLNVEELPLSKQTTSQTSSRYLDGGRGVGRATKETKAMSIATSRFKVEELSFSRYRLVELEIAKECDLGVNDQRYFVTCHLGLHIKTGDVVAGYDLDTANISGSAEDEVIEAIEKTPSKIFIERIVERLKGDRLPGPHNAMSSAFRVEAMQQQINRSKKDLEQDLNDLDDIGKNNNIDMEQDMDLLLTGLMDELKI